MGDIKTYIIALLVIAIIRWLIPKFGTVVKFLVNSFVKIAEKTITKSKMGTKKKLVVTKMLRVFGIKVDSTIDELVELAVSTLNNKNDASKENLNTSIETKLNETVDETVNKLNK